MGRLLVCLSLVALTGPAAACINDIELPAHEREFRSQYRGPASLASDPPSDRSGSPSNGQLIGIGVALLSGAVVVTLTGRRARK